MSSDSNNLRNLAKPRPACDASENARLLRNPDRIFPLGEPAARRRDYLPLVDLQRNHWLALSLTPGLGPTRARKLVDRCGSIGQVFRASLTELEAAGLRAESAQSIALGKSLQLAEEELLRAATAGAQIVTLDDPGYPENLRNIYDPPLLLYIRGEAQLLSQPGLAVVGTRHPTPYGIGMAQRLSADMAARGLVIISGMARGRRHCFA
jgi:DNA processing protein